MLATKIALVTGAGNGIGRVTCQIIAKECGKVVATDYNLDAVIETVSTLEGSDHIFKKMDVSSSREVRDIFMDVIKICGKSPNIVVNAAGILNDNFLLNMTEEEFMKVLNVNLKGTFLVTQQACRFLVKENSPGSVVNISSIIGQRGNRGQSNYAASKAGIDAFTKCVAQEMAQHNIRCNAIAPGFIDTAMTANVPNKIKEFFKSGIPMKKMGTPLASDKSSYITGTVVNVTGGFQ